MSVNFFFWKRGKFMIVKNYKWTFMRRRAAQNVKAEVAFKNKFSLFFWCFSRLFYKLVRRGKLTRKVVWWSSQRCIFCYTNSLFEVEEEKKKRRVKWSQLLITHKYLHKKWSTNEKRGVEKNLFLNGEKKVSINQKFCSFFKMFLSFLIISKLFDVTKLFSGTFVEF